MSKAAYFKFRLYVAGDSPNSAKAVFNLKSLCREILHERHEIEVVDVLHEPLRALQDGILLTPMLVKLAPSPVRKIVGSLNQREAVLQAIGLPLPIK